MLKIVFYKKIKNNQEIPIDSIGLKKIRKLLYTKNTI